MPVPTRIKHVVVLMFENRSFDHMCGWFGSGDGLGPGTFNLEIRSMQLRLPCLPIATRPMWAT